MVPGFHLEISRWWEGARGEGPEGPEGHVSVPQTKAGPRAARRWSRTRALPEGQSAAQHPGPATSPGDSGTRGCAAAGPGADSAWPPCQPGTETRSWPGPLASTFLRMLSLDVTSTQAQRWHQNLPKGGSKWAVTKCSQHALSRGNPGRNVLWSLLPEDPRAGAAASAAGGH